MRKLMFAVLVFGAAMFAGCDKETAPPSTRQAFTAQYPTAVDVEWERKHGYNVAEFHLAGEWGECEAWYTKGGKWVMTKFDIHYNDLPEAVQTAFETAYGTETPVSDVERLERNNADTIYFIEAEIVYNGFLTDINLDYSADGKLLRTSVDVDIYENIYYYLP